MKERTVFILLALLFILTRAAVLLTDQYGVGFAETFRATAAYDLITARNFSIFDYASRFNEGGNVVIAFLAAVFFKGMGVNTLALRLAPLLFSFTTFCIGYALLRRFFGFLEAVLFGLFFVFSPQTYIGLSKLAWGTHVESIIFPFIGMYCLAALISEPQAMPARRVLYASLLGFICGFSIWFCYTNMIAVAALMFCLMIFSRFFKDGRVFATIALSMLVGALPLVIFSIHSQGANWNIYSDPLPKHFLLSHAGQAVHKILLFFSQDLPASFFFDASPWMSRPDLCALYYAMLIFAAGHITFLMWKKKPRFSDAQRSIPVYCGLHLVLFLAAYAISDLPVDGTNLENGKGYRYLVAFFPLFSILLALSVSRIRSIGKRVIAVMLILVPCCLGMAAIIKPEFLFSHSWQDPTSYQSLGWSLGLKYGRDIPRCLSYADKIHRARRIFFFWGLAESVEDAFLDHTEEFLKDSRLIPEPDRAVFYLSLGAHAFLKEPRDLRKVFSRFAELDEPYRKLAYIGAGGYVRISSKGRMADYLRLLPEEHRKDFFRGVGAGMVFLSGKDPEGAIRAVAGDGGIPAEFRGDAFSGVGLYVIGDELFDGQRFLASLAGKSSLVPAEYRKDFSQGIQEAQRLLQR